MLVQHNLPQFYLDWIYGDYQGETDWSLYQMVAGAQLTSGPTVLAYSPDSAMLACGTQQAKTPVRVWDTTCAFNSFGGSSSNRCYLDVTGSESNGNTLAWRYSNVSTAGGGKALHLQLAGGGSDRSILLFEVVLSTSQLTAAALYGKSFKSVGSTTIQGHRGSIVSTLAFSKDGLMASADTGGVGGLVYVWTSATTDAAVMRSPLQKGSSIFQPSSYLNATGSVGVFAWSPDGKRLASAGDGANLDPTLWLFDMLPGSGHGTNGVPLLAANDSQNWISDLAWSPDSRFLASSGGTGDYSVSNYSGAVQIWDASAAAGSSRPLFRLPLPSAVPYSLTWSPDGTRLAAALITNTGNVEFLMWDVAVDASGAPSLSLQPKTLGGCAYDSATVPQLGTGSVLRWSPNGKMLASGGPVRGGASSLCVWGMSGQAQAQAAPQASLMDSGRSPIRWLAWSSDSLFLATTAVTVYPGQYGANTAGYSASLALTAIVVDAAGRPQLSSSAVMAQLPESILSLAWSSDGRQLASSSVSRYGSNGTEIKIRIWDIQSFIERVFDAIEDVATNDTSVDTVVSHACDDVTMDWQVTYTDTQVPPKSYCTGGNCGVIAFSPSSQLLAYSWLHQVRTVVVQSEAQAALLSDYLGNVRYGLDSADNTALGIQCDDDELIPVSR